MAMGAKRLTSKTRRQRSRERSSSGPWSHVPALFMRSSMPPQRSVIPSSRAATALESVTSPTAARLRSSPRLNAVACAAGPSLSRIAIKAPFFESSLAVSAPMPAPAPVIRMRRPAKSLALDISCHLEALQHLFIHSHSKARRSGKRNVAVDDGKFVAAEVAAQSRIRQFLR